jgi:DNA-binding IclR family transcriptional regulator
MKSRTRTQSIERASRLLRELANRGPLGWRLKDLAERVEMDRTTTHRTLACLVRERLAFQRKGDRKYFGGPLLYELSLSMPIHADFVASTRTAIANLAKRFDALSILSLRSGTDAVCAHWAGKTIFRGTGLHVGMRRPLAFTGGGVAILAALQKEEARRILALNLEEMSRLGSVTVNRLAGFVKRTEALGYALNKGEFTPGVNSISVPILTAPGEPLAALTIANFAKVLTDKRAGEILPALRVEANALTEEAHRIGVTYRY